MANNTHSRKWSLVINNPKSVGLDHEAIKEILEKFVPQYYCMADEIATTGTEHTHIFVMSESPIRFTTMKNRFPLAHIEKTYGSAQENRDYIRKEGKWANTDKAETSIPETFEEWGYLPSEREEKAPMMAQLIQDIQAGKSTTEIITENPKLVFRIKDIDLLRQTLLAEKYTKEQRSVEVTYLYGATGVGKTYGIFQQFPAQDICRITDYSGQNGVRFDSYHCQDVLVLEEFRSQIPVSSLLNYLDKYPLFLPARYNDRVACFSKVFITSNIPLTQQYCDIQRCQPETWRAFCRRIDNIIEYLPDGNTRIHKKGGKEYDYN